MTNELPHFDSDGNPHMVDVGSKNVTNRMAKASCVVTMKPETAELIRNKNVSKGNVLELARIAGIMASKKTADVIPLCHPLGLDSVDMDAEFTSPQTLLLTSRVSTTARTGVEMEAMHSVLVAALTVYDMCKSVDRAMTIGPAALEEKSGGKSGHFVRD